MVQSEWRQDDGYSESIVSADDGCEVIKFRAVKNGEGRYDALARHAKTGEMVLECSIDYATQEEAQASCNAAVRYVKRLVDDLDRKLKASTVETLIGMVDALIAEATPKKPKTVPTGVNLTGVDPSRN